MKIAIVGNDTETGKMLATISNAGSECLCFRDLAEMPPGGFDVLIDLSFKLDPERIKVLRTYLPTLVFVNSVCHTLAEFCSDFVRISGWPGFIGRGTFEIALGDPAQEPSVNAAFEKLGWKYLVVKDVAGMIGARVLAMIINEAYYALDAGVSSKTSIDLAMKLGTNYPYGPFEWADKIGLHRIAELLTKLQETDAAVYAIAPGMLADIRTKPDGGFLQAN